MDSAVDPRIRMAELSVVIVATDNEQRALLQVLVDGTSVARTVQSCTSFPMATGDPVVRRVLAANPDVILVDIPADNAMQALRGIELLREEMPDGAIFAIGILKQPQVIVNAMRAGVLCRAAPADRKSTRLNSSHLGISYAVFCLK